MLNVYSHPDTVTFESDPELLRFTYGSGHGEVCIFLDFLPPSVKEFLRAAGQVSKVVATVNVNVEDNKRTVKIVYEDEDLKVGISTHIAEDEIN